MVAGTRRVVLLAVGVLLLHGCAGGGTSPQTGTESVTKPVEINMKGLWHKEYAPLEEQAVRAEDLQTLAKLSLIRYNTAIASYNDAELLKQLRQGEVDARVAVQAYVKQKRPDNTAELAKLLRQLALYEERLENYRDAQHHMEASLAQKVPRDPKALFWDRMDLARIYLDGRNDPAAAKLMEQLLAEYKKNPKLANAQLLVYDQWIKAIERVDPRRPELDRKREELKNIKVQRADQLQDEADAALTTEQGKEK